MKTRWYVYMLECSDGTLYTGVTTDIVRREHEHNHTNKGAKYTRPRRPVRLVGAKAFEGRSAAMKEEHRVKKLPRDMKIQQYASLLDKLRQEPKRRDR